MIQEFELEKVHKAGARFNPDKAKWFNHEYIIKSKASDLLPEFQKILKEKGIKTEDTKDIRIIELLKERVNFVKEIWEVGSFFWIEPSSYQEKFAPKSYNEDRKAIHTQLISNLESVSFTEKELHDKIHEFVEN